MIFSGMTTEFELELELLFCFIKFAEVFVVLEVGVVMSAAPVMSLILR